MTALPLVDEGTRRRRAQRLALARAHRGARVEVRLPVVPWPRAASGRLVVADRVGPLDGLALRTVVPDRVRHPTEVAAGTVCPAVVRYRTEDGEDLSALLAGDDLATAIRRAVAIRGLVIEVHLLPAQRRDLGYRIAASGPTMNA